MVVEVIAIQIVVVISCGGNDIEESIGNAHKLIALLLHIARIGIAIIPAVHNHVLRLNGGIALSVSQCTPAHSLFAEALNKADIVVGKLTELLDNLLLGI